MEYIIIGNGVAGTEAAKAIRRNDNLSEIKIFSQDHYPFYSRPRLPELLAKEVNTEDIFVRNYEWYNKNKIQSFLNCTVKHIDPKNQKITLKDKSCFTYSKLLLATGSSSALPPIDGINTPEGIFTLRTVEDALTITKRASLTRTATLIGGGLLGLEAGNGRKKLGLSLTNIEFFDRLLPRQLDGDGESSVILKKNGRNEFKISPRSSIKIGKRIWSYKNCRTKNGNIVESNFILVSAGIKPNITLAQAAGIAVNKGIIVNDRMETNITNVYAAGYVAEYNGRMYGIWPAAQRQGVIAGINMSGGKEVYKGTVPSTTLKVAGIHLTSMGDIAAEDKTTEQIKVTDPSKNIYKKLFLKDGKIVGATTYGK